MPKTTTKRAVRKLKSPKKAAADAMADMLMRKIGPLTHSEDQQDAYIAACEVLRRVMHKMAGGDAMSKTRREVLDMDIDAQIENLDNFVINYVCM